MYLVALPAHLIQLARKLLPALALWPSGPLAPFSSPPPTLPPKPAPPALSLLLPRLRHILRPPIQRSANRTLTTFRVPPRFLETPQDRSFGLLPTTAQIPSHRLLQSAFNLLLSMPHRIHHLPSLPLHPLHKRLNLLLHRVHHPLPLTNHLLHHPLPLLLPTQPPHHRLHQPPHKPGPALPLLLRLKPRLLPIQHQLLLLRHRQAGLLGLDGRHDELLLRADLVRVEGVALLAVVGYHGDYAVGGYEAGEDWWGG